MERRKALKNIGLSLGGITMSASVASMLQSCSDGSEKWDAKFFSPDEAQIVTKTLDVILPSDSDVPGASELNLTQFIDTYISEVSTEAEQEGIKAGIGQYLSSTLKITGKSNPNNLSAEDIEERLKYYFKADPSLRFDIHDPTIAQL